MFEKVLIKNEQQVELEGFFFKANSDVCVLEIPGFGVDFNDFAENLGDFFTTK